MAWVRFDAAFDFTPKEDRRVTLSYPAGWSGSVREDCAAQAVKLGLAERIPAPPQAEPPKVKRDRGR